ncbi:MAG TPA: acyltransferase [Stellaceae bacterium]|nr:acyltransferase [Stellaceae bacterium]
MSGTVEALPRSARPGARVTPVAHDHLLALDGIRFLAAFCVLAGHGYWYVVLQQIGSAALTPVSRVMMALPGPGMTLFFVLSGFVIHFNYHHSVGIGRGGNFSFFIARFSRLYPLFLAIFSIDFVHLLWFQGYFSRTPRLNFDLFGPLPFFLSFTETWLFIPIGGHALYEHYGYVTSHAQGTAVMWSLSTEALFYLIYPLFSVWLACRGGRSLAIFAATVALAGLFYYGWVAYHQNDVQVLGIALFGTPALAQNFAGWVNFYSPIGRMSEFLIGAAAAQYYLSSPRPGWVERWPAGSSAVIAAAVTLWIVGTAISGSPLGGVNASLAAVPIAGFVLVSVLRRSWTSRFLSSPILVKCGEASYSLYLLHYYTMHEWAAPRAAGLGLPGRIMVYFAGILISLALARVVYLVFERPALRWLRANFRPLKLHITLGAVFLVTTFFCVIASLQIHAAGQLPPP